MTTDNTEGREGQSKGREMFWCDGCRRWTPNRELHVVRAEHISFSAYHEGEKLCDDHAKHAGIL